MSCLVALAAFAIVARGGGAQDSTKTPAPHVYRGRVIGVFDDATGKPVEGVQISDMFTGLSVLTTATGTAALFFVDTAGGLLSLRKIGYRPMTMAVANSPSDTVPVTVTITPVGTVLPTVVTNDSAPHYISPALQGFEERRRNGMGSYISDAELRKMEGEPLALVFPSYIPSATIKGGNLISTRKACRGTALRGGGCTPCYATVFTDGVLTDQYTTLGATPPDFSHISTDDYAGVEFYASAATMPAWISPMNSDCGVLLLWTRER